MSRTTIRSIFCSALLLLATASPTLALTLGVLPAHPVEEKPFTLVVGLAGSCPVPVETTVTPGSTGVVTVEIEDVCLGPVLPRLIEVPIGPLTEGPWVLRVQFEGEQKSLPVDVESPAFEIEVIPASPRAESFFFVRFTGNGSCPQLDPPAQDGNLITLRYLDNCNVIPPSPHSFAIERSVELRYAGTFVVQVVDETGRTLASRRFRGTGLAECAPSPTALCLLNGRFRVEATWRTAQAQGVAFARPETADSGAFWFFGPDNLELLVKVLDACQTSTKSFWVFAAGLTDVEVEITVTDMASGQAKRYRNRLGKPFAPIQDTAAFTCLPPFPGG